MQLHNSNATSWIDELKKQCDITSQRQVAKKMGYTAAVISQVINGKYCKGNLEKVELAFRGAYMGETVNCPIKGSIPTNECLFHQARPFAVTNPLRARLYRECNGSCPHSEKNKSE